MSNEVKRNLIKSSSWSKVVTRKWLNFRSRSNDFHSDSSSNEEDTSLKRKESWSDQESNCFIIAKDSLGTLSLSLRHGGWLIDSSNLLHSPPVAKNIRLFVGTWNVGGKAPIQDLNMREWLFNSSSQHADVYVIGFQEVVHLDAGNVLGAEDVGPAAMWLALIRQALNVDYESSEEDGLDELLPMFLRNDRSSSRYRLIASKQMVGIYLCVWARAGIAEHVRNVKVSCVGTGIMGYMGNKGSVSISMSIQESTFCFVCTHLSSGEKEGDELKRNSDIIQILRRTKFPPMSKTARATPVTILEHDKIIWLGDLNYRLSPNGNNICALIHENNWNALLERDQLRIEQKAGNVLRDWQEGEISFPPTYKYKPNSEDYAFMTTESGGDKRRTPAWCDRILWRGKGMSQLSYSRSESKFSDHRPVQSLFMIEVDDYANIENQLRSNSSCSNKVQAEELLVITRTQSCLSATRF